MEKVTIQFTDGKQKKVIIGGVIEENDYMIKVQCDNAIYELNKRNCDWIKRHGASDTSRYTTTEDITNRDMSAEEDKFSPSQL